MRRIRVAAGVLLGLLSFVFAFPSAALGGADGPPADAANAGAAAAALAKAEGMYWERLEKDSPTLRVRLGLPVDRLPDLSLEKSERDAAFGRSLSAVIEKASAGSAGLTHEQELSAEILRREARVLADGPKYYWLTFPVTPYTFQFIGVHAIFAALPLRSRADVDRYIGLLGEYPGLLRAIEAKLKEQARRGIVIARPEIPLAAGAFEAAAREKEQNLFWPAPARLASLSPEDRAAFEKALATRLESETRPAVAHLIQFLKSDEYGSKAPASVGLGQYPGGAEYYRVLVRRTTTLDVTPEEIHKIGLAAMEELNAELDGVRQKVGFPGSLAEFRKSLKADPRFYAKTPDEVGERLMAAQNRILPKIPDYFGHGPKAPFSVKRLEPQLEGSMTFGYYQVPTPQDARGYYKYNGTNLGDRSLIGAGSLISHELVPGHHFQINLQHENERLPRFRREALALAYTAFIEGWGEYSSYLAGEMGMYADPYDLAGRLLFDAFLTSRLVVDTGMNALGWSRERAMDYMRANTIQSDTEIGTETLRYSCDLPSQALAYKMGMRKFVELREKAKAALGASFDNRTYHDMLLGSGALPMDLTERKVDWFISEQKTKAAPAAAAAKK